MSAGIGRRDESGWPAAREVDRSDDPARKIGMAGDAAVDDGDADPPSGDAELTPDLGRTDLEDTRARREIGPDRRVERDRDDVVVGDVLHVRVARELENLVAGEAGGDAADDR